MRPEKICIECNKGLARHWGRNFCKTCLGELLNAQLREDDAREMQAMQKTFENT